MSREDEPWKYDIVKINIIQEYISDWTSYRPKSTNQKHKMDYRIYFMVEKADGSHDPKLRFFDGFGRVALHSSTKDNFEDVYSYLTNTRNSHYIIKKNKIDTHNGENIGDFIIKNHEEIQSILKTNYDLDFTKILKTVEKITQEILNRSNIAKE